jgi:Flp pilus assembly protein TadG
MKVEPPQRQANAQRCEARQQGAVLVEFALVLPVLLLLLLGMADFGRAFNYWIDENHLANVAARWAAVDKNPGPDGTLQKSILGQADTSALREGGGGSEPAEVCIEFLGEQEVGEPVKATVTYDYHWMPFISQAIGGITSTTITGSATMRIEKTPSQYREGC